ncbi:MAG: PepSY domain-containing protein [Candidatus Competibacteraceae bacterium]
MQNVRQRLMLATLTSLAAFSTTAVLAADLTKEQATEMATKAHPGQVIKTYQETHKGQKVWEVQVKGDDGKKWEIYYTLDGKLMEEKSQ